MDTRREARQHGFLAIASGHCAALMAEHGRKENRPLTSNLQKVQIVPMAERGQRSSKRKRKGYEMSNTVIVGCVAVAAGAIGFLAGIVCGTGLLDEVDINFDEEDYNGWSDKQ